VGGKRVALNGQEVEAEIDLHRPMVQPSGSHSVICITWDCSDPVGLTYVFVVEAEQDFDPWAARYWRGVAPDDVFDRLSPIRADQYRATPLYGQRVTVAVGSRRSIPTSCFGM
jgi:hypothetical protein